MKYTFILASKYNISIFLQYTLFINHFNVCIVYFFRKLKIPLLPSTKLYSFEYSFASLGCFCWLLFDLLNMISLIRVISLLLITLFLHPHATASAITSNHSQNLDSNLDFLSLWPLKSGCLLNISHGCPEGISNTACSELLYLFLWWFLFQYLLSSSSSMSTQLLTLEI